MYLAVTITPSPYKKMKSGKRYKDLNHQEQSEELSSFLQWANQFFDLFRVTYEICPTSNNIHAHLCVQPISNHEMLFPDDIVKIFVETFVRDFGYSGKSNKREDFIKIESIKNMTAFYGWEAYMYKEYEQTCILPLVVNKDDINKNIYQCETALAVLPS